jgi:hypothetical protein
MDDRLNLFTEDLQQERQIKIEVDDTILYFNRAGAAITPRLYPSILRLASCLGSVCSIWIVIE